MHALARHLRGTALCATLLASASAPVRADAWVTAEVPAATAVSGQQEQVFRAGAMPSLGVYLGRGWLTWGFRVRAGVLRDGTTPTGHMADPGTGGLATAGFALRAGSRRWAELVVGGGLTGSDPVPTVEAGVGWSFHAGPVDVGPSLRYLRVVASSTDTLGSANLVLAGIDVQLGRDPAPARPAPLPVRVEAAPLPPSVAAEPEVAPVSPDDDRVVDSELSCKDLLDESEQEAGCAAITVLHDRIILDDRVLFDTDHARVKSAGREIIRAIARAWQSHPDWVGLRVEGHADVRGGVDYNQALSERRAANARNVLVGAGVPAEHVTSIGFGLSRPRAEGTTPEAHQQNRRVEFVIERGTPRAREEQQP